MQWELQEFWLDEAAGPLKVFNYEVTLKGSDGIPQVSLRGDGIYHSGGTVRLNREDEIHSMLTGTAVNPQQLVEHLQVCVRAKAEKTLRQRIAVPQQEVPQTQKYSAGAGALSTAMRYLKH